MNQSQSGHPEASVDYSLKKKNPGKNPGVTHSYFPVGVKVFHVFCTPAKSGGEMFMWFLFSHLIINKAVSYILPTTRVQYSKDRSDGYMLLS